MSTNIRLTMDWPKGIFWRKNNWHGGRQTNRNNSTPNKFTIFNSLYMSQQNIHVTIYFTLDTCPFRPSCQQYEFVSFSLVQVIIFRWMTDRPTGIFWHTPNVSCDGQANWNISKQTFHEFIIFWCIPDLCSLHLQPKKFDGRWTNQLEYFDALHVWHDRRKTKRVISTPNCLTNFQLSTFVMIYIVTKCLCRNISFLTLVLFSRLVNKF
jgi:hypothetical protein